MQANQLEHFSNTSHLWLYKALMRIRPSQLADFLKRCLVVKRRHIKSSLGLIYWIDPVSILGLALLSTGQFEPQMTHLVQTVLRSGDTFLDVGANEGYFSIIASTLVGQGQVYSIEPQTRLQAVLEENIARNKVQAIIRQQLAFSNQEGSLELFLRPTTNTGSSSMFPHWKLGWKKESVKTTTLDAFFARNAIAKARLMKMDCEGAEELIIQGSEETLRNHLIDFIALEYHVSICGEESCIHTHTRLIDSGYVLTKLNEQYIYHLPGLESELSGLGNLRTRCDWNA